MKNPKKNHSITVRKSGTAYIRCPECGGKFNLEESHIKQVHPLTTTMKIFTAEEMKAILDYVQNDAKIHPNKITKTTELMVLILAHGLMPKELLDLNIEDLPYFHKRSVIIVHNQYDVESREVYLLDDNLETKINEYVQKYRQGAKPKDPLFVSRNLNRTMRGVLTIKLMGQKQYRGGGRNIGLSGKLSINPLYAIMFQRTVRYQLRGRSIEGKNAEKKQPKSKAMTPTLKEFMRIYCQGDYSDTRLKSLIRRIYSANEKNQIELPKHIEPWKNGQSKRYSLFELVSSWHKYKEVPNLPLLDRRRIDIEIKKNKELQEF